MSLAKLQQIERILTGRLSRAEKRARLLGRRGLLSQALRSIKELPAAERRTAGQTLNDLRQRLENELPTTTKETATFDLSWPAAPPPCGGGHPINQTIDRAVDIFTRLGFSVLTGPEIVTDENNFALLNYPPNHPARDLQDSLYIKGWREGLLRTHTSAMQIPALRATRPPLRLIVPGKTYRREADATHTPMFHQLEGFIVDEQVTFADLKGLLTYFAASFFGADRPIRFRPHYFPFTEPSAELDILWESDHETRWLEIAGCGCIHPVVLANAGLNPRRYQGIAFGFGMERPFMLRHGVNDIRLLYDNKMDFLQQFRHL